MIWEYIEKVDSKTFGIVYELKYEKPNGAYCWYIGKLTIMNTKRTKALDSGESRVGHIEFYNKRVKLTKAQLNKRSKEQIKKNVTTKIVKFEKYLGINKKWEDYEGSSTVAEYNPDYNLVSKEIIDTVYIWSGSKKELTYLEMKHQFKHDVLENSIYINGNIAGKFMDRDISEERKF